MKRSTIFSVLAVLVIASLMLAACPSAATPAPTAAPAAQPTATPVPATATPVPPTATPAPAATEAPVAEATAAPTEEPMEEAMAGEPIALTCERGVFKEVPRALGGGGVGPVDRTNLFHPGAVGQLGEFLAMDANNGRVLWRDIFGYVGLPPAL